MSLELNWLHREIQFLHLVSGRLLQSPVLRPRLCKHYSLGGSEAVKCAAQTGNVCHQSKSSTFCNVFALCKAQLLI